MPTIVLTSGAPATIYTITLSATATGWSNYNVRQLIAPSLLSGSAGPCLISVKIGPFPAGVNGTIDSAWVGEQASAGNAYNFDGNQVQLTFGGAGSTAITPSAAVTSDAVPFTYSPTKTLIVSVHLSGPTVNLLEFSGTGVSEYYLSGADQSSATAPTGTWTSYGTKADISSSATITPAWNVPADWNNSNNTIHCLGPGGPGAHAGGVWGGGGAGGAYARRNNVILTPSGTAAYQIGVPGGTTGAGTSPTANTWFKDASTCVAPGGAGTSTATGALGSSTNAVGDTVYPGGSGANGVSTSSTTGAGGGAAGINGNGGNAVGTTSGSGDANTGGAAVSGSTAGTSGNAGTEWPGGVGSGSGASGQTSNTTNPSVGGAYGGGASGTAGSQSTFGQASGGLIVIVYTAGPVQPTLFYPVEQPAVPRAPAFPILNPAMRTSFGISVAGPLFLPIPPAATPSAWFDMAGTISRPGFPGQTPSDALKLQTALASMEVVGFVPPIYIPPPVPGRVALNAFYFVPLDELVLNLNSLINAVNGNFVAFGLDPHLLIPTFMFINADELTDAVNAVITAANGRFHTLGLSAAQDIRLFYSLDPNDATLALNTLADELNANLAQLFGS